MNMNSMLYLVGFLLATMCLLVLGVNVWVLIDDLRTIDVPPSILHPVKLWILYYGFHLTTTWVNFVS